MAAVTGTVLAGGMAAYQIAQSEKQRKNAQKELNDYDRQTLDNAFENIQINTAGSDLLREQGAQTTANMVDAVQNGGTRAIIGGLPKVGAYTNQIDREAARMLDEQYQRRDYAAAGDNARIENITENRDINNINALSSQVQAGKQGVWDGIMGATSAASYGAKNIDFGFKTDALDANGNPILDENGDNVRVRTGSWRDQQIKKMAEANRINGVPSNNIPYTSNKGSEIYTYFPNSNAQADPTAGPNQYNPFFDFTNSYNGY